MILVLILVIQNLKNVILLTDRLHVRNMHSIAMVSFTSKQKDMCFYK